MYKVNVCHLLLLFYVRIWHRFAWYIWIKLYSSICIYLGCFVQIILRDYAPIYYTDDPLINQTNFMSLKEMRDRSHILKKQYVIICSSLIFYIKN
jgi:hypothetical protein